jgi:hypothetical protein
MHIHYRQTSSCYQSSWHQQLDSTFHSNYSKSPAYLLTPIVHNHQATLAMEALFNMTNTNLNGMSLAAQVGGHGGVMSDSTGGLIMKVSGLVYVTSSITFLMHSFSQ